MFQTLSHKDITQQIYTGKPALNINFFQIIN